MPEFVHSNYGSETLVFKTLNEHNEFMDKPTVSENKDNDEAALFYIDQCSECLYTTLTLALSLYDKSIKLLTTLDQFTGNNKKRLIKQI